MSNIRELMSFRISQHLSRVQILARDHFQKISMKNVKFEVNCITYALLSYTDVSRAVSVYSTLNYSPIINAWALMAVSVVLSQCKDEFRLFNTFQSKHFNLKLIIEVFIMRLFNRTLSLYGGYSTWKLPTEVQHVKYCNL